MTDFTTRQKNLLGRARENGYMHAIPSRSAALLRVYGLWCWRLKLPIIWIERRTPRSKYARLCLDMFTTPNVLTRRARWEIERVCNQMTTRGTFTISEHEVICDGIPLADAPSLARVLLRMATSPDGCERRRTGIVARMPVRKGPELVDVSKWGVAAGAD